MRTPLTEAEHQRLRMLISWGFLDWHPADERLINLGLAEPYLCAPMEAVPIWITPAAAVTTACLEVVGPEGIEPYYERDGSVNQVSYPTIGQPDVLDPANAPQRSKR